MEQINVIREKAAEAEAIVKAITGDIQRLDVAKRNLTGAIQTLERWGMFSGSLDCGYSGKLTGRACSCAIERPHRNDAIQGDLASSLCEWDRLRWTGY